ncbi:MAG TPA: DUF1573 domain-containing protein [Deltaproteobacteria bacterium]|nr:DUF1573 domain-containing protein [Deltaproteobacteria bacterium]HXK47343.1 DUF1573 domain-containing protein [Deltaproteobacteria bacterium]
MKRKVFFTCLLLGLIGVVAITWGWCSIKDTPPAGKEPKTHFYFGLPEKPVYSKSVVDSPKSTYVFEPVLQFDMVRHDFIVRNTTGRDLELKKVQACCGSLVESYSRQIPAGKEGVIQMVLLTNRRGGEEITGTVRALTNDPKHPEWTIDISCYVKKFADISMHTIMLEGSWRKTLEGSSMVIPSPDYPFRITGLKPKKGRDITYAYRETTRAGRKGYLITVKNKRKKAGVIRDTIYVQTDNAARPEFMIRIQGKISD